MYIDANIFVFANLIDEKGKNARDILDQVVHGKKAITSALALDEVMWVLVKNKIGSGMRNILETIYATPNLDIKEVGPLIPLQALDLIEKYKLKPRDAMHLAMMQQHNIDDIASDDADFDKVPWVKRIGI